MPATGKYKVYIIDEVHMLSNSAFNALLKTLEEPPEHVVFILATTEPHKVLPTIVSRCEVLRVRKPNRRQVIEDAIKLGAIDEDAELLSAFYYVPEQIIEHKDDPDYLFAKQALQDQLNAFTISSDDAIFTCQKLIISKTKVGQIKPVNLYLTLLADAFQDMINISINNEIYLQSYDNILKEIVTRLKHLEKSLIEILNSKKLLEKNVNIGLILDHVVNTIVSKE